jgi:Flp pilus assembly protein TadD
MRIWKIAAVTALALSSFAADNVAPTKSELEDMYNRAFRAFDTNDFPQALKELDAIDARQPDLAASQNLRGVILMRQGIYDKAETALLEAARLDPKFWNARFNLAEIPFLKKDWTEARSRFQQLLSSSESDLASEAAQLIQYKILLTYLLEGKENMVDSILAKLELSPDTPAVDYVKAAVAFQHKNEKEAKGWVATAEKKFSPQLNKLFAESLYEVGWLQKPAGQGRASLPLTTAAERSEKTKALARSRFEQAQQAMRQRDFVAARKLVDEADQTEPNQPATLNLRGEILMEQKEFDEAEAAFKKAAKLDPKFREAQYNLAQIPFKKKDYAKARERFESLFEQTPGGDKNQASQLIKFKIYMTLLLEGKESRAQAMMEQFQFTGDTPALYYAQAAWEFKHNNPDKATDWTASATKIYSPALNSVFADAFYDLGWMKTPEIAAAPAPPIDTASVIATQTEASPAIEPSPIPGMVAAANRPAKEATVESLPSSPSTASPSIGGMEAAASQADQSSPAQPQAGASNELAAAGSPAAAASVPEASTAGSPVAAPSPAAAPVVAEAKPSTQVSGAPTVAATPAAVPASARVRQWSGPAFSGMASRQMLLFGGLFLAGVFLLAWVIVPELRRRTFNISSYLNAGFLARSRSPQTDIVPSEKQLGIENHFFGGPRQVSLQLAASEPSLRRRGALPLAKAGGAFGLPVDVNGGESEASSYHDTEPDRGSAPVVGEPVFETVGPIVEQRAEVSSYHDAEPDREWSSVPESVSAVVEEQAAEVSSYHEAEPDRELPPVAESVFESVSPVVEQAAEVSSYHHTEPDRELLPVAETVFESTGPVVEETAEVSSPGAPQTPEPAKAASITDLDATPTVPVKARGEVHAGGGEAAAIDFEPIGQGQPIPYQMPVSATEPPIIEAVSGPPSYLPSAISNEPVSPRTTPPATMPEPIQTPTAPVSKTPVAVTKPQPAGTMQTSVQLTFSFEIASMQLTPTFKMGVLQVRPTSKIVTMRLAPSQHPQPAMNLQVSFEIAKIQPTGGAFGNIRMTPSQPQKPSAAGSPSFMVGGLHLVPSFEATPVQLTPSQQGRAAVFVTVPFQITSVEFSPSLEIGSVVLNSNSKQVLVQLPGAGPSPAEGPAAFEISNLELGEGGDIAMMQLNLLGHGAKRI